MYGFLRERRWIVASLVVGLLAVLFVNLGFWQIRRLHWRRDNNALILARREQPLAALAVLVRQPLEEIGYRRVTATGEYDPSEEIVLFGRPGSGGQQGNHLLTPFVTSAGDTVIVDRGWVPLSDHRPPVEQALPPAGKATVTGILLPPESGSGSSPPLQGQVKEVNLAQLERSLGTELFPAYLMLQTQEPAQGDLPQIAEVPELTEGPHLSYAIQWFLFTIIGLAGYAAMVRKEAHERSPSPATAGTAPPEP